MLHPIAIPIDQKYTRIVSGQVVIKNINWLCNSHTKMLSLLRYKCTNNLALVVNIISWNVNIRINAICKIIKELTSMRIEFQLDINKINTYKNTIYLKTL